MVPVAELTRIKVLLAPYAYLPMSLPPRYIYIDWKHGDLTPTVAGQLLTIDFAAPGGGQIIWSSSRVCDSQGKIGPSASGYPGYGYGMVASRSAVIEGRRVYFSQGNHGSNAWTCARLRTVNGRDYVAVGIWESNDITPIQAMRLVAQAVPAGGNAVIDNANQRLEDALAPLALYFQALSRKDFAGMWQQFTPALQRQISIAHLRATEATTHDFDLAFRQLAFSDPNTLVVLATFDSTQGAAYGPNGDTRDHWTLDYTLRYVSGRWLIDGVSAHNGSTHTRD